MLGWIIQISIISVLFIFTVHYLLVFLKNTLTIPKVKDLVHNPMKNYQNMYDTISHNNNDNSTAIDLLPSESSIDMKNELKTFLKQKLSNNEPVSYDDNNYSPF